MEVLVQRLASCSVVSTRPGQHSKQRCRAGFGDAQVVQAAGAWVWLPGGRHHTGERHQHRQEKAGEAIHAAIHVRTARGRDDDEFSFIVTQT